jgi:hypothetical protein
MPDEGHGLQACDTYIATYICAVSVVKHCTLPIPARISVLNQLLGAAGTLSRHFVDITCDTGASGCRVKTWRDDQIQLR